MKSFLLYFSITSMLISPDFFSAFRLDDISIILLLLLIITQKDKKIMRTIKYPIIMVFIYLSIITMSILYNLNFFEFYNSKSHYFINGSFDLYYKEIIRAFKALIIILIAKNMEFTEKQTEKFLTFFLYLSFLLAIIGTMQYSNYLGINEFIANNYATGDRHNDLISYDYIISGGLRISTTFYNPNIYAAFLLIPFSLSLKRAILDKKFIPIIGMGLITINLFFTQSRTGILAAIIIFLVYICYKTFVLTKINLLHVSLFSMGIPSLFFFLSLINLNIIGRIKETFSTGLVASSGRSPIIEQVKEILTNSPIFGYSPIATNDIASDNELKIFIHYGGMLGLFFYFLLIYLLYKGAKNSSIKKYNKIFLITLVSSIVLVGITNGYLISNRILPIFLIVYFLMLSVKPPEKQNDIIMPL